MNKIKLTLVAGILIAMVSCGGKHEHQHDENSNEQNTEADSHEHKQLEEASEHKHLEGENSEHDEEVLAVALYQCPMLCEGDKTYDKAGKCPTCGMALEKVKKEQEEHTHGEGDHSH